MIILFNYRSYIYAVIFMSLFMACDNDDIEIEQEYIYMPQATVTGGINNLYSVPSGGGKYTYNFNKKDGKINVLLGVSRSGTARGKGFSIDLKIDLDETEKVLNSGEVIDGEILPNDIFSFPKQLTIEDGAFEKTFYLSIDSIALLDDLNHIGKNFVITIEADNPSEYMLNEELSKTTVVLNVDRIRDFYFKPKEGFLYRSGTELMLNGRNYKSVGLYAPTLDGCVAVEEEVFSEKDIDSIFSILPENSMVRTHAYKSHLDRTDVIIKLAEKHNIKLSLSLLEGDNRGCGAYWVGNGWYNGGYKEGDFLEYVKYMGDTYKNSPAIGIWEIVDRPGQYMDLNQDILKPFLDDVAKVLKNADANHLVSSGLDSEYAYGPNQTVEHYQNMHNSVYIDIGTLRDIDWNVVGSWHWSYTYNAMINLDKSFIIMETTLNGGTDSVCDYSLSSRVSQFLDKVNYYFDNGTSIVFSPPFSRLIEEGCDSRFDINGPLFEAIVKHPRNLNLGK